MANMSGPPQDFREDREFVQLRGLPWGKDWCWHGHKIKTDGRKFVSPTSPGDWLLIDGYGQLLAPHPDDPGQHRSWVAFLEVIRFETDGDEPWVEMQRPVNALPQSGRETTSIRGFKPTHRTKAVADRAWSALRIYRKWREGPGRRQGSTLYTEARFRAELARAYRAVLDLKSADLEHPGEIDVAVEMVPAISVKTLQRNIKKWQVPYPPE